MRDISLPDLLGLPSAAFRFSQRLANRTIGIGRKWLFEAAALSVGGRVKLGSRVRFAHPTRFMGRGTVVLGDGAVLGFGLAGACADPIVLQPRERDAVIVVGPGTYLVNGTEIIARQRVEIGRNCRIGQRCSIIDSDFHGIHPAQRDTPGKSAPIRIGSNVWLGNDVVVLKGVTIGDDAVVGAHTVVTHDIPAGAILVGAPPRVIGDVRHVPD